MEPWERPTRAERTAGYQCLACGTFVSQRNGNFCPRCITSGTIAPVAWRPADEYHPSLQSKTAFDLAREDQQTFPAPSCPALRIARDAVVLAYGPAGAGKSTWAILLGGAMTPAAYVSAEMGLGPALGELCRRLEVRSKQLHFYYPRDASEVFRIAEQRPRLLVIDSATASTIDSADCSAIAKGKGIAVVVLAQVNKAGTFTGVNRWAHEADIVLRIEGLKWISEKNRYAPAGATGEILCASDS